MIANTIGAATTALPAQNSPDMRSWPYYQAVDDKSAREIAQLRARVATLESALGKAAAEVAQSYDIGPNFSAKARARHLYETALGLIVSWIC